MRVPLRPASLAVVMLLALAAPAAAQPAVGIGFGLGLGTRTGVTLSLGVQVTDEVQVVCKTAVFPFAPHGRTCGAHLYVLEDPDHFLVAEVGTMERPTTFGDSLRPPGSWVFVQAGFGVVDHELKQGDEEPEYPRWINASYAGGLTLVVGRVEQDIRSQDRARYGRRRFIADPWPFFFADAQVEIYVPGRDCELC